MAVYGTKCTCIHRLASPVDHQPHLTDCLRRHHQMKLTKRWIIILETKIYQKQMICTISAVRAGKTAFARTYLGRHSTGLTPIYVSKEKQNDQHANLCFGVDRLSRKRISCSSSWRLDLLVFQGNSVWHLFSNLSDLGGHILNILSSTYSLYSSKHAWW